MASILQNQRRLTREFIKFDPTDIALIPTVESRVPGEGITKTPGTPRASQRFTLIWNGSDGYQTSGEDGTFHKYDVVVVGLYDCICEVGDVFILSNKKYIIHSEYPQNNYERKFGAIAYG